MIENKRKDRNHQYDKQKHDCFLPIFELQLADTITFLPMNKTFLLGIILLTAYNFLFSQPKFEQESRIQKNEVPQPALSFIDSCLFNKKVKWYQEISNEGVSLEAKTRFLRRKYSIEFDTLGVIQDVEIEVEFEEIPETVGAIIRSVLDQKFSKYRVVKTQLQLTGESQKLWELVKTNPSPQITAGQYEIVINGKMDRQHVAYELLFSVTGEVLRESEIITQQTDHLDY